jgi:hypothetical protein
MTLCLLTEVQSAARLHVIQLQHHCHELRLTALAKNQPIRPVFRRNFHTARKRSPILTQLSGSFLKELRVAPMAEARLWLELWSHSEKEFLRAMFLFQAKHKLSYSHCHMWNHAIDAALQRGRGLSVCQKFFRFSKCTAFYTIHRKT